MDTVKRKKIAILQIEIFSTDDSEASALGLIALKNYYTIYDMEKNRVGIVA